MGGVRVREGIDNACDVKLQTFNVQWPDLDRQTSRTLRGWGMADQIHDPTERPSASVEALNGESAQPSIMEHLL